VRPVLGSDYEDAADRRLRAALDLAWPVQALVRLLVRRFGEPWLNGKITGQGIKVGPRQLAHLHALNLKAAAVLDVAPPDLFVIQSASLAPTLLGADQQNTLALPSALLESSTEEQLYYFLGREMGHIKSQHVVYLTLLRGVKDMLGSALRNLALPVLLVLYDWQRAATLSADRAGLIAAQDLHTACGALLRLAVGSPALHAQIDIEQYTRAGLRDFLERPIKTAPELLEEHPYMPRRLANLYDFWASPRLDELYPGLAGGGAASRRAAGKRPDP
jgi:Zn-dependent protease with chaperone function